MALSLIGFVSLATSLFCGMRIWNGYRRQRRESRMCRAVRVAFLADGESDRFLRAARLIG